MSSLSGHFLDVMRGLPTLVAHRRARAQSATDRDDHRPLPPWPRCARCGSRSPPRPCSSWWPPSPSRWSRSPSASGSPHGDLDLHTALVVLLLAPEAYWPLRRVGAEFHAAAEGVATFEAVDALLDRAPRGRRRRRPRAGRRAAGARTDVTVTYAGRTAPALGRLDAVLPGARRHRAHRPVRLRQVHPARRPRRTRCRLRAAASRAGGAPGAAAPRGSRQVAWLPQRPHLRGRQHRRQPAARPPRTPTTTSSGRRCAGSPSRSGSAPCPTGSTTPLGEDGATLSAGERARLALARVVARRPPLGAPRRADRPPRRADRAGHRRHPRRARPDAALSSWSPTDRPWWRSPTRSSSCPPPRRAAAAAAPATSRRRPRPCRPP